MSLPSESFMRISAYMQRSGKTSQDACTCTLEMPLNDELAAHQYCGEYNQQLNRHFIALYARALVSAIGMQLMPYGNNTTLVDDSTIPKVPGIRITLVDVKLLKSIRI
jgi:hypothetical protein